MATSTPEGVHPDDMSGDEWKGDDTEPSSGGVQYERPEEILTGNPKQFVHEIPRMREVQSVPMFEASRVMQRLKEILHEEVGEAAKLETVCAWVSIWDRVVMTLKDELGPRLKTFFDTHGTKNHPFPIDVEIPGWVRSNYITRVNMELSDEAKLEHGTNIFRDPLIKG